LEKQLINFSMCITVGPKDCLARDRDQLCALFLKNLILFPISRLDFFIYFLSAIIWFLNSGKTALLQPIQSRSDDTFVAAGANPPFKANIVLGVP
jgi:hypothetical protein